MANMKNEPRKQQPNRKERRQKRVEREDERPHSAPAIEQRDRDEDAPRPPLLDKEDEP